MTQLHDDPIHFVSKRVLLVSLFITVILIGISYLLEWSIIQMLIGFWTGVLVNLISFRLIVMGAKKLLEKNENGVSASQAISFFGRFGLYTLYLFLMAQISLHALLAAAVGLSMVGLVLKLNGFFPTASEDSSED